MKKPKFKVREWTDAELRTLYRSHMRCYANSWREHRQGMPAMAKVELAYAIQYRNQSQDPAELTL